MLAFDHDAERSKKYIYIDKVIYVENQLLFIYFLYECVENQPFFLFSNLFLYFLGLTVRIIFGLTTIIKAEASGSFVYFSLC